MCLHQYPRFQLAIIDDITRTPRAPRDRWLHLHRGLCASTFLSIRDVATVERRARTHHSRLALLARLGVAGLPHHTVAARQVAVHQTRLGREPLRAVVDRDVERINDFSKTLEVGLAPGLRR